MSDETETQESETPQGDPPAGDAATDAATRLEEAIEKEYRTLEDFDPDQQKFIEEYAKSERSAAVNGYIDKQKATGKALTQADLKEALDKRDAEYAAKEKARTELERTLFENHGISVGSADYRKFSEAQADFKVSTLRTPEGVAKIVRAAGIKTATDTAREQEAQGGPVGALYKPKAYDGSDLQGVPPTGLSISDLNKD